MVQNNKSSEHTNTVPLVAHSFLERGMLLADRFEIIALLGAGGQAQVYHAHDQVLDIDVAVKVLEAEQLNRQDIDALRSEVLLARQVNHPNIIRIHEFYQTDHFVFFTMGWIKGTSLASISDTELTRARVDKWLLQLTAAIESCHDLSIVHGDIKPHNIVIDDDDNAVLVDFGVSAQYANTQRTHATTREYAAPEILQYGQISEASDRFSLGRVIAYLLDLLSHEHKTARLSIWYFNRARLATKLQHATLQKRPSLAVIKQSLGANKPSWIPLSAAITFVLVVLAVGIWAISDTAPPKPKPEQTTLAIVTDGQADLDSFATLLQLNLQANPQLYVLDADEIKLYQSNLGIKPTESNQDRARLAEIVQIQLLLTMAQRQLGGTPLWQIALVEYPGGRTLFSDQFDVNSNNIQNLMQSLSEELSDYIQEDLVSFTEDAEQLAQLQQVLDAAKAGDEAQVNELLKQFPVGSTSSAGVHFASAELALAQGNEASARDYLTQIINDQQPNTFWRYRAQALMAQLDNNLSAAADYLDALIKMAPTRPDIIAERASIASALNNLDTARELYLRALKYDSSQAMWWFQLARIKIIQGDMQAAIDEELTQALVRFRQQEDMQGQGLILNAFGVAYLRQSQLDTAAQYFEDALKFRTAEHSLSDRVTTLGNLATVFAIKGDYDKADAHLREAKQLLEQSSDFLGIAHIENERGLLLEEQSRYSEALSYYKRALDLRMQHGDSYVQSQSINNVAFIHFLLGDFSLAEVYWRQAIQALTNLNEQAILTSTQLSLTHLLILRGEFRQAEQILSKLAITEQGNSAIEVAIYLQLSRLNFSQSRINTAAENIAVAIEAAQQSGDSRGLIESHLWAAEMAVDLGQLQLADSHLAALTDAEFNAEQALLKDWLVTKLALARATDSQEQITAIVERTLNTPWSRPTEVKVLTEAVNYLQPPWSTLVWERLDAIVSPAMYESYMAYLAAKGDTKSLQLLRVQLTRYPLYWRNSFYWQLFDDEQAAQKKMESLQHIRDQLSDEQQQYFEANTLYR